MATLFRVVGALGFDSFTTTERDALNAQERLFIFNSTTGQFEIYLSAVWYGLLLLDADGQVSSTQHGSIIAGDRHPEYVRFAAPEEITAAWELAPGGSTKAR